jgi:hypothetical protein
MCNYDGVHFGCDHNRLLLRNYCHFARNDPNHMCLGVKVIKKEYNDLGYNCPDCVSDGLPEKIPDEELEAKRQAKRAAKAAKAAAEGASGSA